MSGPRIPSNGSGWLRNAMCAGAISFVACGPSGRARSPSLDYPPPPAQTADGEVVGADRVSPGDKLEGAPQLGNAGVTIPTQAEGEPSRPLAPIAADDPRCHSLHDDPFVRGRCLRTPRPVSSAGDHPR